MIIEPKTRGFICTTAHPTGCNINVSKQIEYIKQQPSIAGSEAINNVLVIGASTGYGLASLIAARFGLDANTLGVFFERPASGKRTASAGWYNMAAFEEKATGEQLAMSVNGDAFSNEVKERTVALIKQHFGKIDLIVYSLASPRRIDPNTGQVYQSVLKTRDTAFHNKTIDPLTGQLHDVSIEPASPDEIAQTVKVMGGEDWALWIQALQEADVLADQVKTVAYSYIGPELTHPIYRDGTIGQAKADLERTATELTAQLKPLHGNAYVSVNKAVVTQSSAAIPVVPLYISILFKVMKEKGLHEDCIEQIYRLFNECLYPAEGQVPVDSNGRIRIDDWEMQPEVQAAVAELWPQINTDNAMTLTDLAGYRRAFFKLFGFEVDGVDYQADVDPKVPIASLTDLESEQ